MTGLIIVAIFSAPAVLIYLLRWIDKKICDRKNDVANEYGVTFENGILTFKGKGANFSEIIKTKKMIDFTNSHEEEKTHYGSVTVGGVTTGGTYKTGGYDYTSYATSSGKYSLNMWRKSGDRIDKIQLTPEQYAKASQSEIAEYLDGNNSILVINPNVYYSEAEMMELRMFAMGVAGTTTHLIYRTYPSYEKCCKIMNWLTQED